MSVNEYEREMNELLWDKMTKLFGYSNAMKSNSEELTDFFIPFDDDILLIEDKSKDEDFEVVEALRGDTLIDQLDTEEYGNLISKWITFYNKKIKKAVKQLNGAESYLKENKIVYKNNLKVDANKIDYKNSATIHKIVLLHSIDNALQSYYNTCYPGLLYNWLVDVDNLIIRENLYIENDKLNKFVDSQKLFSFGNFGYNVHIITEKQFKFMLTYLPTLCDIINYLKWKEFLLKNYKLTTYDEYSLICWYIQYDYSFFNSISKKSRDCPIYLQIYEDKDIFELEIKDETFILYRKSSNRIKSLIHYLGDNKTLKVSENFLRDKFLKYYLKLDIKKQLDLTDAISEILDISYEKSFIKCLVYYYDGCVYLFSNIDHRIDDDDFGRIYTNAFLSKFVLVYLENYKDKFNISDVVLAAFHKRSDDSIYDIYASINIDEHKNDLNSLKNAISDLDSLLPQKFDDYLNDIYQQMLSNRVKVKGRDRNKFCPCGSGKKYKKCCGKTN